MSKIRKEKFKVLNGVFDEKTLDTLKILKQKKYFDTLLNPIKTGKESDVFLSKKENKFRAIKIYRLTTANFKKISSYINRDFRFKTIKGNMRKIILIWVEKEFRNLLLCHKKNINVPFPYKQQNNIIIMEYLEGKMLKDSYIENPKKFFNLLLEQLYLLKNEAKLIHGDLSEFNILSVNQIPFLIDFGQSILIKNENDFENIKDLYERDIKNIVNYFNKTYDLKIKSSDVFQYLSK